MKKRPSYLWFYTFCAVLVIVVIWTFSTHELKFEDRKSEFNNSPGGSADYVGNSNSNNNKEEEKAKEDFQNQIDELRIRLNAIEVKSFEKEKIK